MKCLILAAGYATRLYPLTENFPKPLLKVGKKTILDWLVDDIDTAGLVDQYVVISNHKFAPLFENWASSKKITVLDDGTSSNETRLGAVRDIQFAIDTLGLDDDLLVIAGDNVLDFSLVRFLEYARDKGTSCIMRYYEPSEEKLHKTGVVLFLPQERRTAREGGNRQRLRRGCPRQFHRLAFCADSGPCLGNAREALRYRQSRLLRGGPADLPRHFVNLARAQTRDFSYLCALIQNWLYETYCD